MPPAMVTAEMAGQDLVEWAIALSRRSYQLVVDDMAEEHRVLSLGQLHRAIQTSSISLVEVLQGSEAPFALTRDQVMVVRETARLAFPLRDMVRGLRVVQRHWTEVLLDLAEQRLAPSDRPERVRQMLEALTRFFDDTIDSVMVEYLNERQRLLDCARSTRREMVLRLLAGEPAEDAGGVLGLDLTHHHLAVALGCGERVAGSDALAPALVEELACVLRAPCQLVVPGTDEEQWAWLSGPCAFDEDALAEAKAVLARRIPRAGIGRPRPGREGFCRALAEARDALRVARLRPDGEGVVAFEEVRLAALLSADLDRARAFVLDELGELAGDLPALAELRSTLRAYFESDQSLVKTAARLYLHRNTVVYRLRRIEQLLGRPVGEHALELHAALDLVANLGGLLEA